MEVYSFHICKIMVNTDSKLKNIKRPERESQNVVLTECYLKKPVPGRNSGQKRGILRSSICGDTFSNLLASTGYMYKRYFYAVCTWYPL